MPQGVHKVLLQHYRIDDIHSNSYTAWKQMGSPQSPTAEQYEQLRRAGQLELMASPQWIEVTQGSLTISLDLPRQATSLLRISW